MSNLSKAWKTQPLLVVMLSALAVRLIAVFFAPGYLMHDDHFVIVEPAGSWADGFDFNRWLPWSPGNKGPQWTSMFYVGTIWLMLEGLQALDIHHPGEQMVFIRLIHALFSLLTVYYGYRIAKRFGGFRTARNVGMLLALFAFFPNLATKQLQEMVCIPPIMAGMWWLVKREGRIPWSYALYGGLIMGVAVSLRYQAGIIPLGAGIALLLLKHWRAFFVFGFASLFSFALTQAQDIFLWGRPFAHLQAYIDYNSQGDNIQQYIVLPWYNYILTLLGFLIPPASLMILFGFFREWRRALIIVLPVVLFLVFHSIYPNKQERFLLPVLPLIITIGTVGWYAWVRKSYFWQRFRGLHFTLWLLFWLINSVALAVLSTSPSKSQKIQAMIWLYEQGDSRTFVQEYTHSENTQMPPQFYSDNWRSYYIWNKGTDVAFQRELLLKRDSLQRPNYILFMDRENLEERAAVMDSVYGGIRYRQTFEPGRLDKILHRLNPRYNSAEWIYIYEIEHPDGPPEKKPLFYER